MHKEQDAQSGEKILAFVLDGRDNPQVIINYYNYASESSKMHMLTIKFQLSLMLKNL